MKKIKIAHIIGKLGYGGAEKLLLDLCRKIDKSKFEVLVLSLQGGGELVEQFEKAGITVEIMNKKRKFNLSFIKKVTAFLQTEKPDIVHTHLFVGDFYGGVAALNANVPVIVSTKHDILSEGFWRDFLSRRLRMQFTKIIAISKATKDHLIKTEKISCEKVEVIYNGIDVAKFYLDNPQIFKIDDIVIGSVGRLSKEKGHKHLIRACRFLRIKNWQLILVGDGPLRKELAKAAQMLGLEEQVQFTGAVADVRPYLQKMDIFVLPSVSEGLSLSIIEAALAGRFVIATDVGGVPEIILHKENGLLFKPKSIEQLVAHLNWAIENKAEASRMAQKLQQQVAQKFDINKIILQYQNFYLKLVKNS